MKKIPQTNTLNSLDSIKEKKSLKRNDRFNILMKNNDIIVAEILINTFLSRLTLMITCS